MKRVYIAIVLAAITTSLSAETRRSVLIRTAQPYDAVVAMIEDAGGTVSHRFKYVSGIAAEIPASVLARVQTAVGPDNLVRDDVIPAPSVIDLKGEPADGDVQAANAIMLDVTVQAGVSPANYTFNAAFSNVASLHAAGYVGAGAVIAVIDSGYRPIMVHVSPSRLISPGLNLVPGPTEPAAISDLNHPHGTFVAGMAAANIGFCLSPALRFVRVAEHYGAAVVHPDCAADARLVSLIGSAPGAAIFPIKIFPAAGGGSPFSRTIQAMEAAIALRQKFDQGIAGGLNIQVANLSLGGWTSAAARTLSDQAVEAMIDHDILPVIAAGNEGFGSVTVSSPGTSFAALNVGATSSASHEHIFRAQFSAPCNTAPLDSVVACARAWRPDMTVQMAVFSGRGPTHDGRVDPDVVANGAYNLSQSGGNATTVSFGSGTSYATPTVAGIAAVLRQAMPAATARQVRNAIMMSADSSRMPAAGPNDRGAGFVDAAAALTLLQGGEVPDSYEVTGFTRDLKANMTHAGKRVYTGPIALNFSGVRPSEVTDIPYQVRKDTEKLFVRVRNIAAELPLAQQNPLFTDDVLASVQSSLVHGTDLRARVILKAGNERLWTFDQPEEGVWRVALSGDWTNAGRVSYDVDIWTTGEALPEHSAADQINYGEVHTYRFDVPAGAAKLATRLRWSNMNDRYPVSDIDVILAPPVGPEMYLVQHDPHSGIVRRHESCGGCMDGLGRGFQRAGVRHARRSGALHAPHDNR